MLPLCAFIIDVSPHKVSLWQYCCHHILNSSKTPVQIPIRIGKLELLLILIYDIYIDFFFCFYVGYYFVSCPPCR